MHGPKPSDVVEEAQCGAMSVQEGPMLVHQQFVAIVAASLLFDTHQQSREHPPPGPMTMEFRFDETRASWLCIGCHQYIQLGHLESRHHMNRVYHTLWQEANNSVAARETQLTVE
jgi:hypothetical protein